MRPKKPARRSMSSLRRPGRNSLSCTTPCFSPAALASAGDLDRLVEVGGDRLLAVDVLAGADRLRQQLRPHLRRAGVEEDGVVLVRPAPRRGRCPSARCRAPWRAPRSSRRCGRSGSGRASPGRRWRASTPPCGADRADRADQVLVHAHAPGDAVHDDSESLGGHRVAFARMRKKEGSGERFAHAAQVAGSERRAARPVGHVVERLDRDGAGSSRVRFRAANDRPEAHLALARAAPVRIVHLHVARSGRSASSGRSAPAPSPISALAGGAAVDHRLEARASRPRRTISAASATVLTRSVSRATAARCSRRRRCARRDLGGARRGSRAARARAIVERLAGGDRALLRRAVHQVACRPAAAHRSTSRVHRPRACARAARRRASTIDRPAGATSSQCSPVTTRPGPRPRRGSARASRVVDPRRSRSASVNGAISSPS